MASHNATVRLYSAWFCPYAQRAWMVLNNVGIEYKLIESLEIDSASATHGYKKNPRLLEINKKGLVPTLEIFNNEVSGQTQTLDIDGQPPMVITESIDVMKFVYEHVGRRVENSEVEEAIRFDRIVCSPFYRCLMKQIREEQENGWRDLLSGLESFSNGIKPGKYYKGDTPSIVDFTVFPWAFRLYVLEQFRSFTLDQNLPWVKNYMSWKNRMENDIEGVKETLSDKNKLLNSYERYADASAKSLVGQAVNAGKEAHEI